MSRFTRRKKSTRSLLLKRSLHSNRSQAIRLRSLNRRNTGKFPSHHPPITTIITSRLTFIINLPRNHNPIMWLWLNNQSLNNQGNTMRKESREASIPLLAMKTETIQSPKQLRWVSSQSLSSRAPFKFKANSKTTTIVLLLVFTMIYFFVWFKVKFFRLPSKLWRHQQSLEEIRHWASATNSINPIPRENLCQWAEGCHHHNLHYQHLIQKRATSIDLSKHQQHFWL